MGRKVPRPPVTRHEYPADHFADLEEQGRLQAEIVRRKRGGATTEQAARAVGVPRATLLEWLEESIDFERALLEADEEDQARELRKALEELERRRARDRSRAMSATDGRRKKAEERRAVVLELARSGVKHDAIDLELIEKHKLEVARSTVFEDLKVLRERGLIS